MSLLLRDVVVHDRRYLHLLVVVLAKSIAVLIDKARCRCVPPTWGPEWRLGGRGRRRQDRAIGDPQTRRRIEQRPRRRTSFTPGGTGTDRSATDAVVVQVRAASSRV